MVGLKVSLLCLTIAGSMHGALACDATGMQQCQTDYTTGLGAAQAGGGTKVCDHINTMISCLSSKCSGCAAGATTAFNMIVDNAKTSACASGGTCPVMHCAGPPCHVAQPQAQVWHRQPSSSHPLRHVSLLLGRRHRVPGNPLEDIKLLFNTVGSILRA